jgi:hypothetical protein
LLRNGYNQNVYLSGNKYIGIPLPMKLLRQQRRIVEFPQQRYMLANAASKTKRTLGQGVLSLARKIYFDFDSQEQLAVSIQEQTNRLKRDHRTGNRRDQRTAPRHDIEGHNTL